METISKASLATVAVYRLTRTVYAAFGSAAMDCAGFGNSARNFGEHSCLVTSRPADLLGIRIMDFLSIAGVWISAQIAVWVAFGFAGVLLNWLLLCGATRLLRRSNTLRGIHAAAVSQAEPVSRRECTGVAQLCL